MNATRIMVYSHDAFGLGNLRRMLAICEHLLGNWPGLSILLVSGSPMIHEFRLPTGLDYIKLPCLNRGGSGKLSAKYLGTSIDETVALRSQLIQSAVVHFKPDLFLVDKKPIGLSGELTSSLEYLQNNLPQSKCVLLLRDILDAPEKTVDEWCRWGYYRTIQAHYDRVLVVGMKRVFDLAQAYRLPLPIACKLHYCGYIRKRPEAGDRFNLREQLKLKPTDRLVLVTPGGGEDGYSLVNTYLQGLKSLPLWADSHEAFHSLILCGPEMPLTQQVKLQQLAATCPNVSFQSFTNQLLSYLEAANAVVSMGGYNTLTEILAVGKRAVVVPRTQPSQEQLIRATCFAQRDWVSLIHPEQSHLEQTSPEQHSEQGVGRSLMQAVLSRLFDPSPPPDGPDFDGLSQVRQHLQALISPISLAQPPAAYSSPVGLLA